MPKVNPDTLKPDALLELFGEVAARGERCPANDTQGIGASAVQILCRRGDIRIEISGRNYRQVHILKGPYAGRATAPNPRGEAVWKTIGIEKSQHRLARVREREENYQRRRLGAPSAPGLLPADYFKR